MRSRVPELPLSKGNCIRKHVQVGCGFRVKEIKSHDYIYFWHYEDRGGRSRQIHVYVGAKGSAATARRLSDLIEAYYARAAQQLAREFAIRRQAAAALR